MLRTVKNAEVMQFRPVLGAREGKGEVLFLIVSFCSGCPRIYGLHSNSAFFRAPEKADVKSPLLIVSPLFGIPANAHDTHQFCPLVAHREGKGEVANSDFVPFSSWPNTMQE